MTADLRHRDVWSVDPVCNVVRWPVLDTQYLQVAKDTVYRLIRGRKLAATRIGRAYRVPRVDLEVYIRTNSTRAEVRAALFARLAEIGKRNRGVRGDEVLARLEQLDRERPSTIAYP